MDAQPGGRWIVYTETTGGLALQLSTHLTQAYAQWHVLTKHWVMTYIRVSRTDSTGATPTTAVQFDRILNTTAATCTNKASMSLWCVLSLSEELSSKGCFLELNGHFESLKRATVLM